MIQVELSATEIPIEAGGTAQLTVTVLNKQAHDDHVFLEIEGIDVEWYALPVPAVNVAAGESQSARALFKIGRSSASHAGTYPFIVRAKGMETGTSGIQQASLIVKPFSDLQVELNPKRITSTFLHQANTVETIISNLGNQEETLDLYASDPDDACAYEFDSDRVTVKPGHSETVPLTVEPVTHPLLGSSRLYGYAVTARSVRDSYVVGTANGQLERRPLFSTLTAIFLLLVLLGSVGSYVLFRPRPPVAIRTFSAAPMQVTAGDKVTLAWDIANMGEGSYLLPDHRPVRSAVDSMEVTPEQTTTYTLVARGPGPEQKREVTITVTPRPIAPPAKIVAFTASKKRVHQGEPVTLAWQVQNAAQIVLNPLNPDPKDPRLYKSQQVMPDQTTIYELIAKGAGGDFVSKTVKVEVVGPTVPISEVGYFNAKPDKITTGQKAVLSWSTENAASVEIDNGVGGGLAARGKFEVTPTATTTYTLRAADNKGNVTTKMVTVTVTEPAPPPVDDGTQPPTNPGDGTTPRIGG